MKPVSQDSFGEKKGNCLSACICSILELPIEASKKYDDKWRMGNFTGSKFDLAYDDFLKSHRLTLLRFDWSESFEQALTKEHNDLHYILSGPVDGYSEGETIQHAVVARGGEIVHDPNPRNKPLHRRELIEFLVRR